MVYRLEDILRDVRVAMDENIVSTLLISERDQDTLTLNEVIRSKIVEAIRMVHSTAPVYMLDGGKNFGQESIHWEDRHCGYIVLPDDFLRLVALRMSDWEMTLYSAMTPADAEYVLQRSRWRGLRGTPQKPKAVIVPRPTGRVLEFYSCKDDTAKVALAMYVGEPKVDEDGGIEISERCYRAVVYMAAGLTYYTLSEADKAQVMVQLSKTMME